MVGNRYASITKYSPRLGAQVLELIARGHLVREAAEAAGVTPVCIGLWRRKHEAFGRAYALAIEKAEAAGLPPLPQGDCLRRWETILTSKPAVCETPPGSRFKGRTTPHEEHRT